MGIVIGGGFGMILLLCIPVILWFRKKCKGQNEVEKEFTNIKSVPDNENLVKVRKPLK